MSSSAINVDCGGGGDLPKSIMTTTESIDTRQNHNTIVRIADPSWRRQVADHFMSMRKYLVEGEPMIDAFQSSSLEDVLDHEEHYDEDDENDQDTYSIDSETIERAIVEAAYRYGQFDDDPIHNYQPEDQYHEADYKVDQESEHKEDHAEDHEEGEVHEEVQLPEEEKNSEEDELAARKRALLAELEEGDDPSNNGHIEEDDDKEEEGEIVDDNDELMQQNEITSSVVEEEETTDMAKDHSEESKEMPTPEPVISFPKPAMHNMDEWFTLLYGREQHRIQEYMVGTLMSGLKQYQLLRLVEHHNAWLDRDQQEEEDDESDSSDEEDEEHDERKDVENALQCQSLILGPRSYTVLLQLLLYLNPILSSDDVALLRQLARHLLRQLLPEQHVMQEQPGTDSDDNQGIAYYAYPLLVIVAEVFGQKDLLDEVLSVVVQS
jgi:hypothetical protein